MFCVTYDPIDLRSRNGGGAGLTLLDGTFRTLAGPIASEGVGNIEIPLTIAKDQFTALSVRLMDYRDPAHPRLIQSRLQSAVTGPTTDPLHDGGTHAITAAGDYTITAALGGVHAAIALEVSATTGGALTASDSVAAKLVMSERGT